MYELKPIPEGYIASIVTHLEMFAPPANFPPRPSPEMRLEKVEMPTPGWYQPLFRHIGEDWLWFSRLMMTDTQLTGIIQDPATAIYALRDGRGDIGLLELNWHSQRECQIAFFGLVPEAIGGGAGSWLMGQGQKIAFEQGAERLWLHTCTHDHPTALPFYMRHGFRAFKREVEYGPDPRLTGDLRRDAASFHPIIGSKDPLGRP